MKQGGYRYGSRRTISARPRSAGFTIVETLIVLAVTALLFASAVATINGRQQKTEFTTGIRGLQQQLQQIINETASGYYPNSGNFTCVGSSHPVTFTGAHSTQGTNGGCIFLGKAIQFGSDANASQLAVLPIVGNQYTAATNAIKTLSDARPRAVYPADPSAAEMAIPTDSLVVSPLPYGLKVAANNVAGCAGLNYGMCYATAITAGNLSSTTYTTGTLAFLAGDTSGNIASGATFGLQSGTPLLTLYGVNGAQVNQSSTTAAATIGNTASHASSGLQAAGSASICIVSGEGDKSGLFTIDSGLQVKLTIYGDNQC